MRLLDHELLPDNILDMDIKLMPVSIMADHPNVVKARANWTPPATVRHSKKTTEKGRTR